MPDPVSGTGQARTGIQVPDYGKKIQWVRFLAAVTGFPLLFIPDVMRGGHDKKWAFLTFCECIIMEQLTSHFTHAILVCV